MDHFVAPDSRERWEEYLEKMTKEMCETIQSFGPSASIDLLISLSKEDDVFNSLLVCYPGMAATLEFLSRLPTLGMDKEEPADENPEEEKEE